MYSDRLKAAELNFSLHSFMTDVEEPPNKRSRHDAEDGSKIFFALNL